MDTLPRKLNRVVIAYPSGNTTAIVFDDISVSGNKEFTIAGRPGTVTRRELNAALISAISEQLPDIPPVEQCCAIVQPNDPGAVARVEMFGGEFCGNAARSCVRALTLPTQTGIIEVSGASSTLQFAVKNDYVQIEMPLPAAGCSVEQVHSLPPGHTGSLVRLEGIPHLVITKDRESPEGFISGLLSARLRSTLEKLLKENTYNLASEPAAGISYYDELTKKSLFCVWVREVGTMFDETACGSGTCAIGAAITARERRDTELKIIQPSGSSITVSCKYESEGNIRHSSTAGKVDILYDGAVDI
jgi:diaminopimelate epimerase